MEKQLIKKELSSIDTTQEEMDSYRRNLILPLRRKGFGLDRLSEFAVHIFKARFLWLSVPVTAILLFVIFTWPQGVSFKQESLDELYQLVLQSEPQRNLEKQAQSAMQKGNELERLNAAMVYCMLVPSNEAQTIAIEHLEKEKRPEFRAIYLEYILDSSENLPLTISKVEQLCELETDPHCMKLFKILLKYA